MIQYNGFDIDPRGQIFRDGKQVFTAWWQVCDGVEDAKKLIDASIEHSMKQEQIISTARYSTPQEIENGFGESESFGNWMELHAELQLNEK